MVQPQVDFQVVQLAAYRIADMGFNVKFVELMDRQYKIGYWWIIEVALVQRKLILISLPCQSRDFLIGLQGQTYEQLNVHYINDLFARNRAGEVIIGWPKRSFNEYILPRGVKGMKEWLSRKCNN